MTPCFFTFRACFGQRENFKPCWRHTQPCGEPGEEAGENETFDETAPSPPAIMAWQEQMTPSCCFRRGHVGTCIISKLIIEGQFGKTAAETVAGIVDKGIDLDALLADRIEKRPGAF